MSRDLQYLADLNHLPQQRSDEHHGEDLQVFRNTTFYDFDIGRSTDIGTTVDELLMQQEKQIQYPSKQGGPGPSNASNVEQNQASLPFDFSTLQEFSLAGELPAINSNDIYPGDIGSFSKERKDSFQWPEHQAAQPAAEPMASALTQNPDALVRQVAEEDKRKRNTAASARFRIKKKLREQEMERSSRMMQQKVNDLETKVKQLELENKWLKTLVGERSEARNLSALEDMRLNLMNGSKSKSSD